MHLGENTFSCIKLGTEYAGRVEKKVEKNGRNKKQIAKNGSLKEI